jgi:hypothetical protein
MNIGILFRGISYDTGGIESGLWKALGMRRDYRNHYQNHYKTIINPFRKNHNANVYISSYSTDLDKDLLNKYKPKLHLLGPVADKQHVPVIQGLDLIKDEDLDFIIVTRFDIDFYKDISLLNIDYEKINFLFKEMQHHIGDANAYNGSPNVCDCVFMFPRNKLEIVRDAIQKHRETHKAHMHEIHQFIEDQDSIHYCFDYEMTSNINNVFTCKQEYKIHHIHSGCARDIWKYSNELSSELIDIINKLENGEELEDKNYSDFQGYHSLIALLKMHYEKLV